MPNQRKKSSNHTSFLERLSGGFGEAVDAIEASFRRLAAAIAEVGTMLLSIVIPSSLLKKVEDAGKTQGEKIGKQVGEFTEQVEKKFSKGASGVIEIFQNIFAILVPEFIRVRIKRVSDAVWRQFRQMVRRLGNGIDSFAERYLPKWLVRAIKRAYARLQNAIQSLSKFFSCWTKSRDLRKLAWATPGILMAIPLAACVALSPVYSVSQKQQHYNVAYGKALEEQDFKRADLFAKKLGQLGYQRMERAEYQEAVSLSDAGKFEEAYETMKTVAPETEPGFIFGHIWIASSLRSGNIPNVSEDEAWRLIRLHSNLVLSLDPKHRYAKYLLIKAKQRDGDSVIADMRALAEDYPEFYGELWVHHVQIGELGNARIAARRFSEYVETKHEGRTLSDYTLWAAAQKMLNNLEESQRITLEGSQIFADAPELKEMAAILLLAELEKVDRSSPEALDLLIRAHIADSSNQYVIRSLGSRLANDNTLMVRGKIDELMAQRKLNSEVLLTAGDVHARATRFAEARRYYVEASDYDPTSGEGFNNIAWIHANVSPIDLDLAFGAIQRAIEIRPDSAFLETRGQIYFKRGRDDWKLAAKDLQDALNGALTDSDRQNAHASLASIYEAWGETERAEAHRRQAQSSDPESVLAQRRSLGLLP